MVPRWGASLVRTLFGGQIEGPKGSALTCHICHSHSRKPCLAASYQKHNECGIEHYSCRQL